MKFFKMLFVTLFLLHLTFYLTVIADRIARVTSSATQALVLDISKAFYRDTGLLYKSRLNIAIKRCFNESFCSCKSL